MQYNRGVSVLYNAKATNGDHPILGIDFWSLTDSGKSESTNWGLMSNRNNAYDGKAAIVAPGTDKWGFATGGEDRNYGNFLDEVTKTHLNTVNNLWPSCPDLATGFGWHSWGSLPPTFISS
jgi:hypothetical protein